MELTIVAVTSALLYLFLRTHLGTAMRATGDNDQMMRALGVNVGNMLILGLALANGLVGLSGALLVQYQGFADVQMGIGMWCGAWRASSSAKPWWERGRSAT